MMLTPQPSQFFPLRFDQGLAKIHIDFHAKRRDLSPAHGTILSDPVVAPDII
jgi:hypothetical protein